MPTDPDTKSADSARAESKLRDAKFLIKNGKPDTAIVALQLLLDEFPGYADAMYYRAVCLRKIGDGDAALETIEALKSAHPGYARAYQEEGHNHRAREQHDSAIQAFEQAVALNPALIASWRALTLHYGAAGVSDKAREAKQQVDRLSGMPAELMTVTSLMYDNRLSMAEKVCGKFLRENPQHAEATRLLDEIRSRLSTPDDDE